MAPLGGWMQLNPREAFFRYSGLSFLLLTLPIRLNGSLRLFPPQFFGYNGMFHCPSGPLSALQGTLALLPGKAPDVTALRDPEQPSPPHPSSPCALSLSPFSPYPVDSRLGTSKQLAERSLQTGQVGVSTLCVLGRCSRAFADPGVVRGRGDA